MEIPLVARAAPHFWEEPVFSGTRGSGTVFFSGCNLACRFCQNYEISARPLGEPCTPQRLAELFLQLQAMGVHNINLVTPAPHVEALQKAIPLARSQGLTLPILYNTNAYELVDTLRSLEGLIDIYVPDCKYVDSKLSERLSGAADYFEFAAPAILEMYRQVGLLAVDSDGLAIRGILVRHLVLPGCLSDTRAVLLFLKSALPLDTPISLMGQYVPAGDMAALPAMLQRPLTRREYQRAMEFCKKLGFTNVLIQGRKAADTAFTPPFSSKL